MGYRKKCCISRRLLHIVKPRRFFAKRVYRSSTGGLMPPALARDCVIMATSNQDANRWKIPIRFLEFNFAFWSENAMSTTYNNVFNIILFLISILCAFWSYGFFGIYIWTGTFSSVGLPELGFLDTVIRYGMIAAPVGFFVTIICIIYGQTWNKLAAIPMIFIHGCWLVMWLQMVFLICYRYVEHCTGL